MKELKMKKFFIVLFFIAIISGCTRYGGVIPPSFEETRHNTNIHVMN